MRFEAGAMGAARLRVKKNTKNPSVSGRKTCRAVMADSIVA